MVNDCYPLAVGLLMIQVLLEGFDSIHVQSLECRAPEVWRGLGCWHASNVWSVGITVSRSTLYWQSCSDLN